MDFPTGSNCTASCGVIHTDFEKGFIRAEVISFVDYKNFKTEAKVKEAGKCVSKEKNHCTRRRCDAFSFNV